MMRETRIVERIRKLASNGYHDKALVRGIGDDCAIVRSSSKEDLVFTSDFVLEGRHFTLETHTPADVGHKALARSLSDLAAMGSQPVFCLVSIGVPAGSNSWVNQFYKGFLKLAERYRITLAGGDLAKFDKVVVDVTCCGRVPRGKALLRSGAKAGDQIYVTGELGGSALGFETRVGKAWKRHLRPEPRIAIGLALRKLAVTAAMDLSDGLSSDLQRLCVESKVKAQITSRLPLAPGTTLEQALHGGEDYELLFTAPAAKKVPPSITGVPVTAIGTIEQGKPGEIRLDGRLLTAEGFDHFQ